MWLQGERVYFDSQWKAKVLDDEGIMAEGHEGVGHILSVVQKQSDDCLGKLTSSVLHSAGSQPREWRTIVGGLLAGSNSW